MSEVTTYVFACKPSDGELWRVADDAVGRVICTLSADTATAMVEQLAVSRYRWPRAVPCSPWWRSLVAMVEAVDADLAQRGLTTAA